MRELSNLIQAGKVSDFIESFRQLKGAERFSVLNEQNMQGRTLLHFAAQLGDIELVKHLLGLEIRLNVEDSQHKTPIMIAQEAGHEDIATLLSTRMEWIGKCGNQMPLNKALNLIEGSYHAIEAGNGKNLVLVLGETGVGKSTLINYLNRAHYCLTGVAGFDQSTKLIEGVDLARVGHNPFISETLYPQVLQIDCGNEKLDMADLAGINGTREPVIELAGTLSTHLLSKMASGIKSILFVVDINSLNVGRGGAFRQTIKTLNKILLGDFNGDVSHSVFFAITKLPTGIEINEVINRYLIPLKGQLEGQMLQGSVSSEDMEMYNTVKLMINAHGRIFAPDVCDSGLSREKLVKALASSTEIKSDRLDLLHMDKHQEKFSEMLTFLSGEYLHISDEIHTIIPTRLKELNQAVMEAEHNIKNWDAEITEAKKAQEEGMTPEKAIKMLSERQVSLRTIESKYSQLIEERTRLNISIDMTKAFIKDIDVDLPVEYGRPYLFNHVGELQIIQSSQGSSPSGTQGKEIGAKVGTVVAAVNPVLSVVAEVGGMIWDMCKTRDIPAPKIEKKTGNGTHVFDNSDSPAPGKILRIECTANSGCFGLKLIQGDTFKTTYTYPLGESGTADVTISIATRDLPENKVRLERSQNEIKINTERLIEVERDLAEVSKQIDVLINEINGFQVSGISAAAQQEILKTQIKQRGEWIEQARQSLGESQVQIITLEKQKADFMRQLRVNHDVFKTMASIIHILRLDNARSQILNEFVKCFSVTNPELSDRQQYSPKFFHRHSAIFSSDHKESAICSSHAK